MTDMPTTPQPAPAKAPDNQAYIKWFGDCLRLDDAARSDGVSMWGCVVTKSRFVASQPFAFYVSFTAESHGITMKAALSPNAARALAKALIAAAAHAEEKAIASGVAQAAAPKARLSADFSGLTLAQQYLLTFGGWHPTDKRPQPHRSTVRKLIERGLVIEDQTLFLGVQIPTYTVPHRIHMAWCEHCARSGGAPKDRRA